MSQHYAITMPQLSDTMTEGVVVTWEKQPGDRVERGDIVATVETDKAIMDVEVFKAGYLAGPLADVGATIAVGAALGYITDTAGDVAIAADEVVAEQAQTEMIPHHAGTPIVMPQLSDTMTEGVVVTWEKQPGDAIKRGDIVATVETDKAIMDVEVFQDGFLSGPIADVGSVVEVGHPMGFIVDDASKANDTGVTISRPQGQGDPQGRAACGRQAGAHPHAQGRTRSGYRYRQHAARGPPAGPPGQPLCAQGRGAARREPRRPGRHGPPASSSPPTWRARGRAWPKSRTHCRRSTYRARAAR
jgi:pyruvate/2-oxoglutarate dehydrogenase complex dihydrolipoamide acyltransferase (E2) component